MGKLIYLSILSLSIIASSTNASYAGPFLFWGKENLNNLKIPTLQGKKKKSRKKFFYKLLFFSAIDDKVLRDIYSEASAIVVFVRNASIKLNYENFPKLSEIIGTTEWLYLPQDVLSSDPLEYNVNAEVFMLTGPVEQQDVEIASFFRDAQVKYNHKNILGILATRNEKNEHKIYKRQTKPQSKEPKELEEVEEKGQTGLLYNGDNRTLLYVDEPIVLNYEKKSHVFESNEIHVASVEEKGSDFNFTIDWVQKKVSFILGVTHLIHNALHGLSRGGD
jgi:hypothetical protein